MASAKKKAAKAQRAAVKARYNPYVQRVVDDEDLRADIVQAYESSRDAFGRLSNGKSPSSQLFDNKKLQKDLKQAAALYRLAMKYEDWLADHLKPRLARLGEPRD